MGEADPDTGRRRSNTSPSTLSGTRTTVARHLWKELVTVVRDPAAEGAKLSGTIDRVGRVKHMSAVFTQEETP